MHRKIWVIITVVTVAIFLVLLIGFKIANTIPAEPILKWNNTDSAETLVTKKYPLSKFEELRQLLLTRAVSFAELNRMFDIQCLRKTFNGYYAVLLEESGKKVFVFISEALESMHTALMVVDRFKTREEFASELSEQTTLGEVWQEIDPNAYISPASGYILTAHVVRDGVYVITYTRNRERIMNSVIEEVEFIEDESRLQLADITYEIPFILEIDKVDD